MRCGKGLRNACWRVRIFGSWLSRVSVVTKAVPGEDAVSAVPHPKDGGQFMADQLGNHKVAILVANGFEQVELTGPKEALEGAGASTEVVSPVQGKVKGWQ